MARLRRPAPVDGRRALTVTTHTDTTPTATIIDTTGPTENDMPKNPELATAFHALHRGPELLILANAWDAGSARLIESLGARAIATTSAGVAWTHGYPDGDALPVALAIATTAAIARVIRVPLTVDIEAGYSDDPDAVAGLTTQLIDAGAVGVNLEDGGGAPELLAAKIARVRRAAGELGVDLYINARIDVYLRGLGAEAGRLAETRARAARYRDAGASGIFVPGLVDPAAIGELTGAIGLPLNLLAWPGLPLAPELARLGVRRLSAGSSIAQAALGRTKELAAAFLRDGHRDAPIPGVLTHRDLNALIAGR
jgi:2-methylisocitrate lyase-like PEP mutase family enzyme